MHWLVNLFRRKKPVSDDHGYEKSGGKNKLEKSEKPTKVIQGQTGGMDQPPMDSLPSGEKSRRK